MTKIEKMVDGIDYDFDKFRMLVDNGFDEETRLATPAEVAESKKAICHESAIFMADVFNRKRIRYFTFMFVTENKENHKLCHHSGSTWWSHKQWWIKDSSNRLLGFKNEESLKEFLSDVFREINAPIIDWKNLGQLKKFDWTYGEWVSQL